MAKLYTVAAPSGTGKTSLIAALCQNNSDIQVSISHTTRAARPGEVNGEHYHFVDTNTFLQLKEDSIFLEHATVFNHLYGTSKQWVKDTLKKGINVILEIDWQGAAQIRRLLPDSVSIFILPPSLSALHKRLTNRAQDSSDTITQRLQLAKQDISHCVEFDYALINEDFATTLQQLTDIIHGKIQGNPLSKQQINQLVKQLS